MRGDLLGSLGRTVVVVLEVTAISRRFGDITALDELSFAVEPGRLTGFVGANGAGKTTAMRIIMGIDRPDDGEVRWRGEVPDRAARRAFGYMPEERGLYPKMKVTEQLAYLASLHGIPRSEGARAAETWLEQLGLAERAGDRLEELSLGNQQRVQLVAAVIHEPDLLVLDEPFSGIDPVALETMSGLVVGYAQRHEAPVLLSSHQLELVERLCHDVVIIDGGRLVAAGAVDELRRAGQARDRRLRIEIGACRDPRWYDRVAGVRVVHDEPGDPQATLLQVEDPAAVPAVRDAVLDAARAAGALLAFEEVRPTLTELYREAVVRDDASTDAATSDGKEAS